MIKTLALLTALLLRAWAQPAPDFDGGTRFKTDWLRALNNEPAPRSIAAGEAVSKDPVLFSANSADVIAADAFWRKLSAADIVYVGEQHNLAVHHSIQLEVLKSFSARRPGLVVGLEMIDVTQQAALDDYLAGRTDDESFAKFWKKAWGFSFDLYRPLLEYARARGIAVRGLNAPRAVVSQVAKGGLSSLSPEQRKTIPAEIHPIKNPRYLAYVKETLSEHGPMSPEQEGRMLEAMAVWNETMGQTLVDAGPAPLLVIAGSGHMIYEAGILESVARRRSASQAVVLPYPLGEEKLPLKDLLGALKDPSSGQRELGNYFWLLPGD